MNKVIRPFLIITSLLFTIDVFAQFPYYEPFDNNVQKWSFIDQPNPNYVMTILGGHLLLESKNADAIQTFKYIDFDGKVNYELNTRMVFMGGDVNELNAVRWGMSDDGNKYYVFGFTDGGEFFIGKKDDKLKSIVNFTKTPYIKPKDYNMLQVRKDGINYIFKINGQVVYQAKNLEWFGKGIALKCPGKSRLRVDYISFTNPASEAELAAKLNAILYGNAKPSKASKKVSIAEIPPLPELPITGSDDFKKFIENFEDMKFPAKIHVNEKRLKTVDISQMAFVKQFYKINDEYSVHAVNKITNCADGYLLLLAHKQSNPQSENTEFYLHKFSPNGNSLGNVKVGRLEYMNRSYYFTCDMDFSRQGDVVTIQITNYYNKQNQEKKTLNFNQNFCTF